MKTKTTIYLSDELRRAVKKHIIDIDQSLSEYTESALWEALKKSSSPKSKRQITELRKMRELERLIKNFDK